jgi:L1 cell adhesion molecule like protein
MGQPSYADLTDNQRLVRDAAKNQCVMNPVNIALDSQRMIDRKFSDPMI